jgi:hypothetical protein
VQLIFWGLLCTTAAAECNVDGIEILVSNDEKRGWGNVENLEDEQNLLFINCLEVMPLIVLLFSTVRSKLHE